jgi:hypothetical protein
MSTVRARASGSAADAESWPFDTLSPPGFRPAAGRWTVRGGVLLVTASVLLPLVVGLIAGTAFDGTDPSLLSAVGALASVGVIILGALLIDRGRRMQALPAQELLRRDRRAPVLFLRSFDDDDLVDPTPRMVPLGDYFPRRYEESLARALEAVGPMISIGRPGDTLALLGGGRLFVPDHAWRTAVDYLRHRSAVVALMVGRTEGVWWEIASCLESVPLERLLFFFPYVEERVKRRSVWQRLIFIHPANFPLWSKPYQRMEREREARYALFRDRVQPKLRRALPETLRGSLFIDFLNDGTSRALRTVRPAWWPLTLASPSVRHMAVHKARTLQPFVAKVQGLDSPTRSSDAQHTC